MPGSYGSSTRVKHRISPCSFGSGGPEGREFAKVNLRGEHPGVGMSVAETSRPDRTPREPGPRRRAGRPLIRPAPGRHGHVRDDRPLRLPIPRLLATRPEYVIVVAQLRDWGPGQPPSLAEFLETRPARTREPEPDLEAEP
jgi:hypothetical protein